MERIIRVTGKGKISLKPDTVCLSMNLTDVQKSYEEALEQSARQSDAVKAGLVSLGFKREDVRTTYFDVNTQYENYDKHGNYVKKLVGYRFEHKLKLEFGIDNELLGKVLYMLAHSNAAPEFNITYTVKDSERAKNELIAKAVEDSKAKAEVLAWAAGVALGSIVNIDYSWDELNFCVRPMRNVMAAKAFADKELRSGSFDMDIEPDDIRITDTVTVMWEIQ